MVRAVIRSMACVLAAALLAATPVLASPKRYPIACPAGLDQVSRVIVVTAPHRASKALMRLYERRSASDGGDWKQSTGPLKARIGRKGLAWDWQNRDVAKSERRSSKREGDGKSPAGVYLLGSRFGHATQSAAAGKYISIKKEKSFCVDDVRSPHYNQIVARSAVKSSVSGERMWRIPLYSRGYVVDFPTSRKHRGGSCIFIHLWRTPRHATAGCVAVSHRSMDQLDRWIVPGRTAIAIMPEADERWRNCFD